jgi:hypothetical protein
MRLCPRNRVLSQTGCHFAFYVIMVIAIGSNHGISLPDQQLTIFMQGGLNHKFITCTRCLMFSLLGWTYLRFSLLLIFYVSHSIFCRAVFDRCARSSKYLFFLSSATYNQAFPGYALGLDGCSCLLSVSYRGRGHLLLNLWI